MTETRVGDMGGKASSTGFRGVRATGARFLLGEPEPEGLSERAWDDDELRRMCPAPLTPGRDWVRTMGGARLMADRERTCWEPPDNGDVVRGR